MGQRPFQSGPVSNCRALGAEVIIAVNLNGDLVGRRFQSEPDPTAMAGRAPVPKESLDRMLRHLPESLRAQATQMIPRLLP
jgi:NTE family protein